MTMFGKWDTSGTQFVGQRIGSAENQAQTMEEKRKTEMVFIASPGAGHLFSALEIGKFFTDLDAQLSITVLVMNLFLDKKTLIESTHPRVRVLELPKQDIPSPLGSQSPYLSILEFIDGSKPQVREILAEITRSKSSKVLGIFIDMICTSMIDVANEFGIPSFIFYTAGAAFLGLHLHLRRLRDDFNVDVTNYKDSDDVIAVPTYFNPVPANLLPYLFFEKDGSVDAFLDHAKRYRETKGIIVNTFVELESYSMQALSEDKTIPPVYAIGPVIKLNEGNGQNQETELIKRWLDIQPDSSVVFLCFGSMGYFGVEQTKEIAYALERSQYRFLWSLRRPPPPEKVECRSDYENLEEVLPEGFLQRTAEVGKVIGWAPQVAILSHPAVGGFVSHCGWSSTLESVWHGVPIAAWPIYSEQQVNSFLLIKDLGMAIEIKMDYRVDFRMEANHFVSADVIEKGIKQLMDPENEVRKKAKEMKEKSRLALSEGGSSTSALRCFLNNVIDNAP